MIKNLLTPVLIGFARTIFAQNSIFQEASVPENNRVFNYGDESMEWIGNCDKINKKFYNRSSKRGSLKTRSNIEMYFAPSTPTSLIKVMVLAHISLRNVSAGNYCPICILFSSVCPLYEFINF